jgi:hypothetical protein
MIAFICFVVRIRVKRVRDLDVFLFDLAATVTAIFHGDDKLLNS